MKKQRLNSEEMKLCSKCKEWKEECDFNKNRSRKDGLSVWCKNCISNYARKYYLENSKTLRKNLKYEERHRTIDGMKQKRCSKCKKWKEEIQFVKNRWNKDGLCYYCKDCLRACMRERYKKEGKGLKTYYRYEECHRVVGGMKQKRCRRCKNWKDISDFYKRRRNKDGLAFWCKKCADKAIIKARKKRQMALRN